MRGIHVILLCDQSDVLVSEGGEKEAQVDITARL
jgi:hypothetical protein